MSGCRLIVNADDLGLSQKVNEGITEGHLQGIVTSASIVANGSAFEHALDLLERVPTLDVGVHLTLTEEIPVLKQREVPSLVGVDGRFHKGAEAAFRKWALGRIDIGQVERELGAQISKVVDHGVKVSHLDGHQHLHMLPGIRASVGALAKRFGIKAIRHPQEAVRRYMFSAPVSIGRLLQLLALNSFCAAANKDGAIAPDAFMGFYWGGRLNEERLLQLLRGLPRVGTCELMCHPGIDDPSSEYGHWKYGWQTELDALKSPAVREYLQKQGIRLMSYAELVEEDWKGPAGGARSPR
jgi:chitin disaccharide deacetylase